MSAAAVTGPAPLLQLEGINTYYGQIHILQDSNLVVGAGELVCLLGGNASGKSTTLKTILGLVRPRHGTRAARRRGRDPAAHARTASAAGSRSCRRTGACSGR